MANFCEKCGSPLNGEKFCPNCGAPVAAPAPAPAPAPVAAPAPAPAPAPAAPQAPYAPQAPFNAAAPAAPLSPEEAKDAADNKVMGILAYLGILVLVPIFAAKNSLFAKFHANQGLTLCIIGVVLFILNMILEWATRSTSYVWGIPVPTHNWVYTIWMIIYWVACIFILVLAIMGIVNAVKGEKKELPIIGKYQFLK